MNKPTDKGEWVSVEDGLPDYDEVVIVYGQRKLSQPSMGGNPDVVTTCQRINIKGTGIERQRERYVDKNEFRQMNYVTHWMPLPSPPNK